MKFRTRLILLALCANFGACGSPTEAPIEDQSTSCEDAVAQLVECGLVSAAPEEACSDPAAAEEIEGQSCAELETTLNDSKSDGFFDDLLCGLGFDVHCPPPSAQFDEKTGLYTRYDLDRLDAHPEGGIYDPRSRAFFVGSLSDGSVTRIDAATGGLEVISPPDPDDWRTLGVAIDSERGRLFVCSLHDVEPLHGEVWEFALDGFERVRHDLQDAAEGGSCNDVAVGPDGIVYVTDREQPNVYRIDPETSEVSLFASDPLLDKQRVGIGQNGIVVLPDGAGIMTTRYLTPALNHISMDGSTVTRVEIDGDFHDFSSLGSGADGMILHDGSLYVAFATELVRVDKGDDWRSVTATAERVRSGMTDVVSAEGELYLLNGQAVTFVAGGDPNVPFMLLRYDGSL